MAKETFSSLIDLFKTSSSSTVASLGCDICGNKLSVFRKKRPCAECTRQFCSQCVQRCRDRALRCKNCSIMTMRPPIRSALLDLKVKDLQHYLTQHNVSTRGCLEKEDLVNVLLRYANNCGNPLSGTTSSHSGPSQQTPPSSSNFQHGTSTQQRDAMINQVPTVQQTGGTGDSDSSSDTSFEMVQRPSSDENVASVASSSSSSSVSSMSNRINSSVSAFSSSAGTPGEATVRLDSVAGASEVILEAEASITMSASTATRIGANQEAGFSRDVGNTSLDEAASTSGGAAASGPSAPCSDVLEAPSGSSVSQATSASNSPNLLRDTMASIASEADFEALSVKQLKDILLRHRVNYHGCCEKAELVERAKRLYRDYCSSRADLEKLELDSLCKICMDAPVECVMLECGHMATCTDCGRQLSECPICRQFVVRIVRTFKA